MNQYVQYGCGFSAPASWLNFDASPTLRFERIPLIGQLHTRNASRFPANVRYGDITAGLPIASDSCRGIYCSHVLEHLARRDCELALDRTFRYLVPGGIFRLVVPDLLEMAETYSRDSSPEAAHRFMAVSGLGEEVRRKGLVGIATRGMGNSRHAWLWDEKSMVLQLERAGFRDIRRCSFNDCEDVRFLEVEDEARFQGSIAIEARK